MYVHVQVKRSPMTCQNGCIELCKLILRRSKWYFYCDVFNTKLRPLSLVTARPPCFFGGFFFFICCHPLAFALSLLSSPTSIPAFALVCVPTPLRNEWRWRFPSSSSSSSSSSSKRPSGSLNKCVSSLISNDDGAHAALCSCKPSEMRRLTSSQFKRPASENSFICTNEIFQKCKFKTLRKCFSFLGLYCSETRPVGMDGLVAVSELALHRLNTY